MVARAYGRHHAPAADGRPASYVAEIVTANRPAALERCITSVLTSTASPTRPPVHVFDNSQDPAVEEQGRSACARLAARFDSTVVHHGSAARQRLVQHLRECGCDPAAVAFAIQPELPLPIGANRNAAALSAAGSRLLSLDDDIVLDVRIPASSSPDECIDSNREPREFAFPADGQPPFATVPGSVDGPQARLGSRAVVADGAAADDHRSGEGIVPSVQFVVFSMIGHDTMDWPCSLLFLRGTSREQLLASEADYRRAYMECTNCRSVPRPTLGTQLVCLTACVGIDNSLITAPFFPALRGEDPLYAAIVSRAAPAARVLFVPEMVQHRPLDARRRVVEDIWRWTRPRCTHLIREFVDQLPTDEGGERPVALQRIGRALRGIADEPLPVFRARCNDIWAAVCRKRIQIVHVLRRVYERQPPYWDADIEAYARRSAVDLAGGDPGLPADLPVRDDGTGWEQVRAMIADYGRLIEEWPRMWQAAQAMADSGASAVRRRSGSDT
jgi:hypothetical protein